MPWYRRLNDFFPKPVLGGRESTDAYAEHEFSCAQQALALYDGYGTVAGKRVIDVGCGAGGKSVWYALHGAASVTGVDTDSRRIEAAEGLARRKGASNISFQIADATALPFDQNSFDMAVLNDCYEHFDNPEAALGECYRVLEPGGIVLMNWLPYRSRNGSHLYDYVYIPWGHLLFPERTLVELWKAGFERDYASGRNRSEPFTPDDIRGAATIRELQHVNKVSIHRFKRWLRQGPFECISLNLFSWGRLGRRLNRLPVLCEYFTDCVAAVLRKPGRQGMSSS